MPWQSIIAIYLLMWSLCLFFVLPFFAAGRHKGPPVPHVPGQADSAPPHFPALRIVAIVSLVSAVMFAAYYIIYTRGLISPDDINLFGKPPNREPMSRVNRPSSPVR